MDRIVAEYLLKHTGDSFRLKGDEGQYCIDYIVDHPSFPNVTHGEYAYDVLPVGQIIIEEIAGEFRDCDIATLSAFWREGYLRQLKYLSNWSGFMLLDSSTMDCISCFASLEDLDLSDAKGLEHSVVAKFRSLPYLKQLDLSNTDIDDRGAVHLNDLATLKKLVLRGTEISAGMMLQLRHNLPDCSIEH